MNDNSNKQYSIKSDLDCISDRVLQLENLVTMKEHRLEELIEVKEDEITRMIVDSDKHSMQICLQIVNKVGLIYNSILITLFIINLLTLCLVSDPSFKTIVTSDVISLFLGILVVFNPMRKIKIILKNHIYMIENFINK